MPVDPTILRALEDAERALAQLRSLVALGVAEAPTERLQSLQEAAATVGVHPDTMKLYAERYGLGHKVGGRWKFSHGELAGFMNSKARA